MELLSITSRKLILNSDNSDIVCAIKHCEIYCESIMSYYNYNNNNNFKYINYMENRISRTAKNAVIILLLFIGFSSVTSSRDITVITTIPNEAEVGKYVEMQCTWDTHGKNLYSVKWYKDGHEFFRYVPDSPQRIQTFTQPGVQLDNMASRENSIRLTNLTLTTTGQYKCEVSTEAPAFAASFRTGNLTVISLPERGPEITGLSSHYAVGENVTANCSTWPSVPKANLHWTINGIPVPKEQTVVYPSTSFKSSGETRTILGLRLQAETRHFTGGGGGSVRIQCFASVGSRQSEVEKHVHMAHVNNQRLSAGDSRNFNNTACILKVNCIVIAIIFIFIST